MIVHFGKKLELLEAADTLNKREMQAYKQENRIHRNSTRQINKELSVLRNEVNQLSEIVRKADEARMKLFQANLLTRVVEKIASTSRGTSDSSEGSTSHSNCKPIPP